MQSHLKERCCLKITGNDTIRFLQGLVTNDLSLLEKQKAIYASLLSPQGKILFDFIILKTTGGVMLDVACISIPDLLKRFTLYKLRAEVLIEDVSEHYFIIAGFGPETKPEDDLAYEDPRHPELGWRYFLNRKRPFPETVDPLEYHKHRIALGVPEGGKDFPLGDTYPHEALLDHLNGISFLKGCYIGQEVVSRMEHRAKPKRRIVSLIGTNTLHQDAPIHAGETLAGKMGSVSGTRGLALLKSESIKKAHSKELKLSSEDVPLHIEFSAWAPFIPE